MLPPSIDAITWDERYAIGDAEIDAQHRRLFRIFNDMVEGLRREGHARHCRMALVELSDYAKYHFMTEETVMRQHRYPDLEDHAREHREFVGVLHLLSERLRQEDDVIGDIVEFVGHWILNHVALSDGKIGGHLLGSARD